MWVGVSFPVRDTKALRKLGLHKVMWGSDYPHNEGTSPFSPRACGAPSTTGPEDLRQCWRPPRPTSTASTSPSWTRSRPRVARPSGRSHAARPDPEGRVQPRVLPLSNEKGVDHGLRGELPSVDPDSVGFTRGVPRSTGRGRGTSAVIVVAAAWAVGMLAAVPFVVWWARDFGQIPGRTWFWSGYDPRPWRWAVFLGFFPVGRRDRDGGPVAAQRDASRAPQELRRTSGRAGGAGPIDVPPNVHGSSRGPSGGRAGDRAAAP